MRASQTNDTYYAVVRNQTVMGGDAKLYEAVMVERWARRVSMVREKM